MALRLLLLVSLLGIPTAPQANERKLKNLYRVMPDGAFALYSGVTLNASFDQHGEACSLILHGRLSGDQVLHLFDQLVPPRVRGPKEAEPFICVNDCEHSVIYQNVTLITGATITQTSDPAAIITFKRKSCEAAVQRANQTTLNITK